MMSPEERAKAMAENPPEIHSVFSANAYFSWGWTGCGFGQMSFSCKDGVWSFDDEFMGPEKRRKLLHALADHIADELEKVKEF